MQLSSPNHRTFIRLVVSNDTFCVFTLFIFPSSKKSLKIKRWNICTILVFLFVHYYICLPTKADSLFLRPLLSGDCWKKNLQQLVISQEYNIFLVGIVRMLQYLHIYQSYCYMFPGISHSVLQMPRNIIW